MKKLDMVSGAMFTSSMLSEMMRPLNDFSMVGLFFHKGTINYAYGNGIYFLFYFSIVHYWKSGP